MGKNYLPLWLILPLFLMLILRGGEQLPNGSSERLSKNIRYKICGISLIMSASLATAMYLLWCPVGSHFIENLSGKYFIPIFPLFFIALPSFNLKKYHFFINEKRTAVLLLITLCYGAWQVLARYYVEIIPYF